MRVQLEELIIITTKIFLLEEEKIKELNIPNIDLKEELKSCKTMEDLVGRNGLTQRLFGEVIQQFLESEMEEHLERKNMTGRQ